MKSTYERRKGIRGLIENELRLQKRQEKNIEIVTPFPAIVKMITKMQKN